jgi:hypothetical protein
LELLELPSLPDDAQPAMIKEIATIKADSNFMISPKLTSNSGINKHIKYLLKQEVEGS